MAITLITEVMDYAPETLTHREHKVLIILAEDARVDTRIIWHSLESEQMRRRARVSRTQLYAVLGALVAKGCLEVVTPGGNGRVAKYRIRPLAPQSCVRENVTQPGESYPQVVSAKPGHNQVVVSAKPGHSVSAKPGHLALKDIPDPADGLSSAAGAAPAAAARNGANPSHSLREHNGTDYDGADDQQPPIGVHLQSPAADRNARGHETGQAYAAAAANLTEWIRQHPEFSE